MRTPGVVAIVMSLLAAPALAQRGASGWIADAGTGCKVWFPLTVPKASATWSGACVSGTAEGNGIERWSVDGQQANQIEGQYHEGRPQGPVIVTYTNGDKYIGNLSDSGAPADDQAVYEWASGDRYQGDFIGGAPNGQGAFTLVTDGLLVANTLTNIVLKNRQILGASGTERLLNQALSIREKALGPYHPDVAQSLNSLATNYNAQGRYADAELLYKRALAIREKAFGLDNFVVAQSLNDLAAVNYYWQGRYVEAEPLLQRALGIVERALGPDHPSVAVSLGNLARNYDEQGRHAEAEPLLKRALAIEEKAQGPDHPAFGLSLNNLALNYNAQGRYADAELLYKRALAIQENALGPDHPDIAQSLNNLAVNYDAQGRYTDAEPLLKRALSIVEKALGIDHPFVAASLSNLARNYNVQGRYAVAESLYKRSLSIVEKRFGVDHPSVAAALNNLAENYRAQGRYADAESFYKHALAIQEKALGPDHPDVAVSLSNLATNYSAQGRYADAELLLKRALEIREKALGSEHPDVAQTLNNLAVIYNALGRYKDAEPLYKRALTIDEKALGPDHPDAALILGSIAENYDRQGRYSDAEPLQKRALAIQEKALGPDHPDVAVSLGNLATNYSIQGRNVDAELLLKRALEIREKALGSEHPDVAQTLNNLAVIYNAQGRYADAEPFYRRAFEIQEKVLGADHPSAALSLSNLAESYRNQGRYAEAEPLYKRALEIQERTLGPNHPDFANSLSNLALNYTEKGRYADAEPFNKRALAIRENELGPDHPDVKVSLNNIALNYKEQGRYADALPVLRRLLDGQEIFSRTSFFPVVMGSQKAGLIDSDESLADSLKILQASGSTGAQDAVGKLAQRFSQAGTIELTTTVRRDQDLATEWSALDKLLVGEFSKPPERRNKDVEANVRKRLSEIQGERKTIRETLTRRFPDYVALTKPPPLKLDEIQAVLDEDEALVAIDVGEKGYAWVVTRTSADWIEVPATAKTLNDDVKTLREAMVFETDQSGKELPARPFNTELAYNVYQQTLGPLSDRFAGKERLSVYVNGALTSLPLEVLVTKDPRGKAYADVDWLMKSAAITNLPSIYALKAMRRQLPPSRATKPMIAFADPVFSREARVEAEARLKVVTRGMPGFYVGTQLDTEALARSLPQLPGTRNEVTTVGRSLGADPADEIFGLSATPSAVKQAKLDQYRVVYFATHALVAGDIEKFAKARAEPALALTFPDKPTEEDNGLLVASDVAQLKLDADWVVLSACNTAAGDTPGAEALSGLARAFIYAGARSLLVSHWEVSDTATAKLMTRLFQIGGENPGLSHGEMLREASLRLLETARNNDDAHPRLWAPFVVVGEPVKPAQAKAPK